MKRDMDLLRKIMLKLESLDLRPGVTMHFAPHDEDLEIEGHSWDEVDYHVGQIVAADFLLLGDRGGQSQSGGWIFQCLSPAGHDFIDAIKNDGVWTKTKHIATKTGGWSAKALAEIAKEIAKSQASEAIKQLMGG